MEQSKKFNYPNLERAIKELIFKGLVKDIEEIAKKYSDQYAKKGRYSPNLRAFLNGTKRLSSKFAKWFAETYGYDIKWLESDNINNPPQPEIKDFTKELRDKKNGGSDSKEIAVIGDGGMRATPNGNSVSDLSYRPTEMRIVSRSMFGDAVAIMPVFGNSMNPTFPPGCEVALAKFDSSIFEYGEAYALELYGSDLPILKRVYQSEKEGFVQLYSDNTTKYEVGPKQGQYQFPPYDISLKEIRQKWAVIGDQKRRKNKAIFQKNF